MYAGWLVPVMSIPGMSMPPEPWSWASTSSPSADVYSTAPEALAEVLPGSRLPFITAYIHAIAPIMTAW